MTMRKPGLAFFSCVCMVQLVTYTNGEVTPPWITLLGCFDAEIGSQSIPLPSNSPTNCFKECKNFSYVGIQNNNCICSKAFQNITDVKNATLRPYTQCKTGENRFMSLYAKVPSLPNMINQDADYGHVYVNISSSSSHEFHASKESTEKYGLICFDFSKQCIYRSSTFERTSSTLAWNECNLVSYFYLDSCLNGFAVVVYGVFWIGMYRDSPDFSSTSSTLSTKLSTLTSSSTPTTSQLTTDTPSPLTTDTPSTASLKVETIRPTASPFPTNNRASIAMLEGTWKNVAIVFIVVSGVLLVVIPMLVVFLRLKKDNHIRHDDEHGLEENHKTQNAKKEPQFAPPNNDTLGAQASVAENKPSQSEQHLQRIDDAHTFIIKEEKRARHKKRKDQERKSNHLDHSEHEKDGEHTKKKKKKKRKKHKRNKRHSDATEIIMGENAS